MSSATAVLSPCTGVCQLGADGLCLGCLRSGEEIAGWVQFSAVQRDYLMQFVLPQREVDSRHE
jgi:predicted Fe-S protein YdhL (DUF1289 family)